ncbi:class I SAM-dependent methyltransferase [Parahaliea maris]|uniref:Class I SAM-dependent methyltransferase n=1 Tax=Parahaliea maris TaxID=2716870 RepID=A0A5C9A721_9GAMM|nr:methyltransferase [Parahaliea maris]TXS95814.1 class I SAM-dependent methyltransferase [Parahaliea maris]
MSAADTRFSTPFGEPELRRYPARPKETLQAWCSADSLLLEAVAERYGESPPDGVLVVNDDHGALALSLAASAVWTDSAMSRLALEENCQHNGRPLPTLYWSTDDAPVANLVVMRVPKQLAFFEFQLARLAACMPAGTPVLVAGMDKHLSPHTAGLMERYLGPTERHRGQRKARLFTATASGAGSASVQAPDPWSSYFCQPLGGELRALPNVFSRDRLDGGSALLLETLSSLEHVQRVTDLACGNGVLGLAALSSGLADRVLFCDESAMAVASTRDNLRRLLPHRVEDAEFHHGDGLRDYFGEQADLVLCNPPFHLQHTVDDYAGRRLLAHAARHLGSAGQLCLVANRHLRYKPALLRSFAAVKILGSDQRFTVWLASSPRTS